MATPNLTQYENPVSGEKGNLLNLRDWWGMILGAGVLVVVWRLGNRLVDAVTRYVPFGGVMGAAAAASSKPAAAAPSNVAGPINHLQ